MKSSGVKEEIGDENRRLARRQGFSPIHHGRGGKGKRASRLLQRSFQGAFTTIIFQPREAAGSALSGADK